MSEKRNDAPSIPMRRGPGGPGRPGGPGGPFMEKVKPKDGKGTLLRLAKYLSSKGLLLAGVLLFCLVSTLVSIFGTQINGRVLDDYVMAGNLSGLGVICLVLLGIYLVGVVCSYFQNTLMVELSNRTIALIRRDLFAKVGRLPLAYFDTHSSGDLMSRLTNDIDNIGMTLSQGVAQLFGGVTMIVGVLIAMLIESPLLTLFGMLTVPLMFLLTRLLAHFSRRYFKRQSKDLGELNGYIEETISGQKTVKLFSHEEQAKKEFDAGKSTAPPQRAGRSGDFRLYGAFYEFYQQSFLFGGGGGRRVFNPHGKRHDSGRGICIYYLYEKFCPSPVGNRQPVQSVSICSCRGGASI